VAVVAAQVAADEHVGTPAAEIGLALSNLAQIRIVYAQFMAKIYDHWPHEYADRRAAIIY
jgi:hypothetical protein